MPYTPLPINYTRIYRLFITKKNHHVIKNIISAFLHDVKIVFNSLNDLF